MLFSPDGDCGGCFMPRFNAAVICATIALAATSASAQTSNNPVKATRISINYDGEQDMVRPTTRAGLKFHHQILLTLLGGKKIQEHEIWGGGALDSDETLGEGHVGSLPSHNTTLWHILPGNKLVRTTVRSQSVEKIEVTVSGAQCSVSASETLKPGFREYAVLSWNKTDIHYMSRREITSASCSVE
jgi:hypothetical protein